MNTKYVAPSMDQQIFNMGLSVETVSAYLNACGLNDAGGNVHIEALDATWSQNREALDAALKELAEKNIMIVENEHIRILPPTEWKKE
ncbi:MAG: hypothetical protein CSA22_05015 [Deltaproteobacteria bacterium]|nr:MAG: hypothetical protein CSA22_05015 [Deltaproteobacteria bacterium]